VARQAAAGTAARRLLPPGLQRAARAGAALKWQNQRRLFALLDVFAHASCRFHAGRLRWPIRLQE
jgi:hypothetical protein